jgi:hypothetical protein
MKTETKILGTITENMTEEVIQRELADLQLRLNELKNESLQLRKNEQQKRAIIRAEKQYITNRIQHFLGKRIG